MLDGCTLSVQRGECVYLVGPSGSGKTTLALDHRLRAAGRQGKRAHHGPRREVAVAERPQRISGGRRSGFVFQRFHLVRGLTALDNVCLPLTLGGTAQRAAERRGLELLDRVGLADKARCEPRRLSVGQCQRVALARALAADPPLILADEPTASLDAELGLQAMQLLRNLTVEMGKTAVVVTHDPRIECFADRILVMENGRVAPRRKARAASRSTRTCGDVALPNDATLTANFCRP